MFRKNVFVRIYIAFLISISCVFTFGEAKSTSPGKRIKADAVILKQIHEYTLNKDGSYILHVYEKKKLLTYYALNRLLGESFISFNKDFQKLKVNFSKTTTKDGRVISTPPNGYNKITNRAAFHFPAYLNMDQLVVSHTGLEIGAVTELDYILNTKKGFFPFFHGSEVVGGRLPIQNAVVIIRVPKGVHLFYSQVNYHSRPLVKKMGRFVVYTWSVSNILPYPYEINSSDMEDEVPVLYFSTSKNWKGLLKSFLNASVSDDVYKGLLRNRSEEPSLSALVNIVNICKNNVHTVTLKLKDTGQKIASPDNIFLRGYGTELEKIIFLKAILKKAGFQDCKLLFLLPKALKGLSGLQFVKKFFVQVNIGGEKYIIDANGEFHNYHDLHLTLNDADRNLLFDEDGTQVQPGENKQNIFVFNGHISKLGSCNASIDGSVQLSGKLIDETRIVENAEKYAKEFLANYIGSDHINYSKVVIRKASSDLFSFSFKANYLRAANRQNAFLFWQEPLPFPLKKYEKSFRYLTRLTPLFIDNAPLSIKTLWKIDIPCGFQVFTYPKKDNISSSFANFNCSVDVNAKYIIVKSNSKVIKDKISNRLFPEFKNTLTPLFQYSRRTVVFKKIEE